MDYLKKYYIVMQGSMEDGEFAAEGEQRECQTLDEAIAEALFDQCECIICEVRPLKRLVRELVNIGNGTGRAKGGHARAESLSPERRAEIAKKAAETRWAKQ